MGKVSKVTCWHYPNPEGGFEADSQPPPHLDWDLWLGPLRWRPYNKAYHPGTFRWFLESGGGNIRDRGAHQFSTVLWCMNADQQVSFTVEATGTPPIKGLWDNPVTMEVVYTFQNPDWTLVWAQPGDKVGKTEFGNVFWGEHGRLVLEWEGAYRPAEPEAVHFKVPPGSSSASRVSGRSSRAGSTIAVPGSAVAGSRRKACTCWRSRVAGHDRPDRLVPVAITLSRRRA